MNYSNHPATKDFRQYLRKNETSAERVLWHHLRNKQLDGYRFRQQHGFGPYILDFYCPKLRLCIELDGGIHDDSEQKKKDADRTTFLNENRIEVVRFRNEEVEENVELVLNRIREYIKMKYACSDPQPPNLGGECERQYIELYRQTRQMICDHSSAVMNAQRDAAFERFKKNGFPTKKVERYKYTDIQKLMEPDYGLNLNRLDIPVNPYDVFKCDVPNLSTALYFVVNDAFYDKLLPKVNFPEGVVIGSLSKNADFIAKYYNELAGKEGDAITDLNTMLAQDGLLVYVPKNVVLDKAIQVINILRSDVDLMVNRRVLIVAEEGAEVKLLFCDHTADERAFLATQVIEVFAKENAKVDLYCMEETHAKNVRLSNVYVRQERNSRVKHNVITLHNGITRNKLDLVLAGEGAECVCNGCVIADKQQHVDNNTLIVHEVPHCTSNELYKYVLDEHSTGAFAGRVYVAHGAQKTSSQMTNQNLCATTDAHMYTQPMLEIYADDVKCAHGSTVGQLNDAALFYMRQRGISEKEARTLLQVAFIREVIDQIDLSPLCDRLHHLIDKRFRGELSKCTGCKLCK